MNSLNITKLIFSIAFVWFSISCNIREKRENKETWIVISSGILITSSEEDKEEFYKEHIEKEIVITTDSIILPSDIFLGSRAIKFEKECSNVSYNDLINGYENSERIASFLSKYDSADIYEKCKVRYVSMDGSTDSLDLIYGGKDALLMISQPYLLCLKKR